MFYCYGFISESTRAKRYPEQKREDDANFPVTMVTVAGRLIQGHRLFTEQAAQVFLVVNITFSLFSTPVLTIIITIMIFKNPIVS